VQWSGRCRIHQLPDCIGNPPPHRRAGTIAIQGQLLHPYRAFCRGLIAVAFQHQVGDAPDVDLGDHARKSYRSNLYLRLKRKKGQTREIVSSSSAMRYPASGRWRQVKARATRGRIG